MRRSHRALTLAAALASSRASAADLRDTPYQGCLVATPPPSPASPPLVLLLHGDEGSPAMIHGRFRDPVIAAGAALFTPRCPRDQGCRAGSYWQWAGDPSWLDAQLDALAAQVAFDRSRVLLAGWSGGASYIGLVAPRLPRFASLALLGGGMPPAAPGCAPSRPPVTFVAGDRNPLHHLARAAQSHFEQCGHPVTFDLRPRADHGGELAALTPQRIAALVAAIPTTAPLPSATPPAPSLTSPPPPPAPSSPPPRRAPTSACAAGGPTTGSALPTLALLLALLTRGLTRRSPSPPRRRALTGDRRRDLARRRSTSHAGTALAASPRSH